MIRYLVGIALLASSAWAGDNLAHEKLSEAEKKALEPIESLLSQCSIYPDYKVRIEVSKNNLTASELVGEAKKKIKDRFGGSPKLTDKELFPRGGDGAIPVEDFQSVNYGKEHNGVCEGKVKGLNKSYDVQRVVGVNQNKMHINGFVLQKKVNNKTLLFYVISEPYFNYEEELKAEVGNNPNFPGISEYQIKDGDVWTFKTDTELQEYLIKNSKTDLDHFGRQQVALARSFLIRWTHAGERLAAGEAKPEDLKWHVKKVIHPISKKEYLAVEYNDIDDDSYTFFFFPSSGKTFVYYYEN